MAFQQQRTAYQSRSTQWEPTAEQRESLGGLLSDLASHSANLVRDEVALARQELKDKLKTVQSAALVIVIGATLALAALLTLCAAIVLALTMYLPAWQAALIVGAVLALAAMATIGSGMSALKHTELKPKQTLETLEENKEWLKEIT